MRLQMNGNDAMITDGVDMELPGTFTKRQQQSGQHQ